MNPAYDIICVGSALLDVYLKSDKFQKISSDQFVDGVALCEVYGGKTEVDEALVTIGGGGTNNAVSFARKGFKTALISEMGTDLAAAAIKEELVREKVDISMLIEEENEKTGFSSMMVAKDGTRSAAIHRGASKMMTKEDVLWDQLNPTALHISSLGGSMELLEGLIGHAKQKGIFLSVNPGSKEIDSASDWGGIGLYDGVDVLLLNREEATKLSGVNFLDEEIWMGDYYVAGPKITVITDGKRGGRVCSGGGIVWYEGKTTETVEETGAGDAFGSGFVSALLKKQTLKTAVSWGRNQAASVVSFMGPKNGLLTLEQISEA